MVFRDLCLTWWTTVAKKRSLVEAIFEFAQEFLGRGEIRGLREAYIHDIWLTSTDLSVEGLQTCTLPSLKQTVRTCQEAHPKRKQSSSNHPCLGAMLVSGRVFPTFYFGCSFLFTTIYGIFGLGCFRAFRSCYPCLRDDPRLRVHEVLTVLLIEL